MYKQLQQKLHAAQAPELAARLFTTTNGTPTLVSILCRLAHDHCQPNPSYRRQPENKRARTTTLPPVTDAILECVRALHALSRSTGIGAVAATINHHTIFGSLGTNRTTEDPVDAARLLRNYECSHQQRLRTYPITLQVLRWLETCIKLLVHQRTVVDLKEKFNHFDVDGDGSITKLEFLNKLQEPPFTSTKKLSAATLRQIVANFDQNGDDEVDFSEFVAFYFAQQTSLVIIGQSFPRPQSKSICRSIVG
jgi:hypothetical protein